MLHITNGEATKRPLEQSGVPGTCVSWDDNLHEGRTPLAWGEEWWQARAAYLAAAGYADEQDLLRGFRETGDPLARADEHDEVVFWFEHDLHDQLLLIRHLWWLAHFAPVGTHFSIVMGTEYLGLLQPAAFPERFAARRAISHEEIAVGEAAWAAFCGDDPERLLPYARSAGPLLYLPAALTRLLEELPAAANGLARSERQVLEVLDEGPRTPEQAFVACARLEDDIWMGDLTFWRIASELAAGAHPLIDADVTAVPGRLPSGTLTITDTGRQVLAGRADHVALNAPSRWMGGTWLTPERMWRWTGSSLLRPAP
jgi:hypothetical protein